MRFFERIKNWFVGLFSTEDVGVEPESRNLTDVQKARIAAERKRREQLEQQLQEIDARHLEEIAPHVQALVVAHEKFEIERQKIMKELQPLLEIRRCSKGSGTIGVNCGINCTNRRDDE